jgi:transcriptional regulator with XRE-family HTH domain
MPNLAALMKDEISRLSRKEVRREVLPLKRAAATYRREIAALKRTVAALQRRAKSIAKYAAPQDAAQTVNDGAQIRFVSKGLVSLRKRLGISAADSARLLGVSMQSIYNWEHKKATPRKEQVLAIAALRSLGKKEAHARLQDASKNKTTARSSKRSRKTTRRSAQKTDASTRAKRVATKSK